MIDWWSLGVCAYELIFGRRPFRGKTNSDLTHAISREPLRFPEDSDGRCSKEGKTALKDVRICDAKCDACFCGLMLVLLSFYLLFSFSFEILINVLAAGQTEMAFVNCRDIRGFKGLIGKL